MKADTITKDYIYDGQQVILPEQSEQLIYGAEAQSEIHRYLPVWIIIIKYPKNKICWTES